MRYLWVRPILCAVFVGSHSYQSHGRSRVGLAMAEVLLLGDVALKRIAALAKQLLARRRRSQQLRLANLDRASGDARLNHSHIAALTEKVFSLRIYFLT